MTHLDAFNPSNPKFEPGRPVYVLLHEDKSHIYPNPDGGAAWSYNRNDIELIRKIIKEDFGITTYHVLPLSQAWPLLCNTQAELELLWRDTIVKLRKIKNLHERRNHYRNFFLRHKRPHPILHDATLKKLLAIE